MVLKRTFKYFTVVVLKRTACRPGSGSTTAAFWCQLTVEEAEAGLVASDVLAVRRRWWLEERRLVLVCQLVKTSVVCQSVGSS